MTDSRVPVRIRIREVPPMAGLTWIRQGFRAFMRQPGGFVGMFGLFLLALLLLAIVLSPLPPVLQFFGVILIPLLTLGFMLGTEAVMNDLPVRPLMFLAPLVPKGPARRALLNVGLIYVGTFVVIYLIGDSLDGGEARRWMETAFSPQTAGAPADPPALSAIGTLVLLLKTFGVGLVSIPLWHAPALIQWGRQGAAQAMFSSLVALWRTRAAFAVYLLGWCGVLFFFAMLLGMLAALLQSLEMTMLIGVPLSWVLSAVFYVTLWFGFVDTFEIVTPSAAPGPSAPVDAATAGDN